MVVDPGCMKCMDCISVCPNDALYFGFGKPSIGVKKSITKNYSLTWPEELFAAVVFFVSFLAVWDVYQLVAMLMALGIATVTTFLAVRSLRLVRSSDLSFYRWNLKAGGVIKKAGWVFLSFAAVWIGLNAHSGYVRYHERAAAMAFEQIRIPDELALARPNPARWLSATDVENIRNGKKHFYAASGAGFFVNKEALSKLAWIEYLSGNTEQALSLLTRAAEHQSDEGRALSLYYRGAIQNRLGRYDEALVSLDEAIAERPDLVTAREEKGESLWQLGRRDEAISIWKDAIQITNGLPLANSMLAGAATVSGKPGDAAGYQKQADQYTPNDPLFHWMLGLRLQNVGMNELAEQHFARAIQLNPEFKRARN
jgi:tetratricopeptide (TPR) repeat protein